MLKVIYSIFLGIILAIFINMGVSTFYQEPELSSSGSGRFSPSLSQTQQHSQNLDEYRRNFAIIITLLAVVLLFVGMSYLKEVGTVADGIILGGVFTLINGIARAQDSNDDVVSFLVVSVAVAAALFLGYKRFAKKSATGKVKKAKR